VDNLWWRGAKFPSIDALLDALLDRIPIAGEGALGRLRDVSDPTCRLEHST